MLIIKLNNEKGNCPGGSEKRNLEAVFNTLNNRWRL